ncbi:hypothetical protein AC578_7646 [Pseudocercospora eumusae]|uniref:Uncharacterized protein n=1 Tax=Pseudocercospora eumusae TaxID=321146 RepID=A0A139H5W8_9PEZI|nr:hypothetical protein AC578_7646 [Pseudocercospora eumusae]
MNNPTAHDIDHAINILAQKTSATACVQKQAICPTQEQMENAYKYPKNITSERDAASVFLDQPEKNLATSVIRHERYKSEQASIVQLALGVALVCAIGILLVNIMNGRWRTLKSMLLSIVVICIMLALGEQIAKIWEIGRSSMALPECDDRGL